MENILISNLHQKDVKHCTTDMGLSIRKNVDKPFKKLCNVFTNANIIRQENIVELTDEEYFRNLSTDYISLDKYNIKADKNNIILERYPQLQDNEPYIFVCNHTCPEDIETVLNIIDRNAYLVLGSIESLKYNPEMYLTFLNGMLPFDIMDDKQRKLVFEKMKRVINTNSILIFPEGSHNYSPNKLINNLFDGPINLSLQTGKKIVLITLLRDNDNNVSYIDVSNPIDVKKIQVDMRKFFASESEMMKHYVKGLSSSIRDRMATSVCYMISRHFEPLVRSNYDNIEEELRLEKIEYAFQKLKWKHDVFDAEYLVKKTKEEKEYEDVVRTLSNLRINNKLLGRLSNRNWVLAQSDIENKDVENRMRQHWLSTQNSKKKIKVLRMDKKVA